MIRLNNLKQSARAKKWPLIGLETLLLIVSAWRTWDFITLIYAGLPAVNIYAGLSVLISEGAYLVWSKFAYPKADQGPQEGVAIGMIALNTVGLLLLSFGENLTRATASLQWADIASAALSFTPWFMLGVNLVGALLYGVLDDDHIDAKTRAAQARIDRNAERDLKHAERMNHINAKLRAIELLEQGSEELSRELAPHYYNDIKRRVRGQTLRSLKRKAHKLQEADSQETESQEQPVIMLSPEQFENLSPNGGKPRPKVKG